MRKLSCINIYVNSCLKLLSYRPEAVFKQQNPCSNHEMGLDRVKHQCVLSSAITAMEVRFQAIFEQDWPDRY